MWITIIYVFISTAILSGCAKKRNDAEKLKPRELSPKPAPTPDAKPKTAGGPAMAPREADDNETINDAKSDWGAPPA